MGTHFFYSYPALDAVGSVTEEKNVKMRFTNVGEEIVLSAIEVTFFMTANFDHEKAQLEKTQITKSGQVDIDEAITNCNKKSKSEPYR